jgi:hypothetical protein
MAQAAAIAEVEVNKKMGKVVVKHVYYAMSADLAVYCGGIESQIVGGVTQGVAIGVQPDERRERRLRQLCDLSASKTPRRLRRS